ncbi:MAG: NAD(P)-dependent dehydrogenase (short-subunit alcohol dehydrogenase family) [Bradymonadia bacterium]|jgi:NAD(P)-dependent dehydrogenase (short-subunit alcohol dehydrogenase family)
MSDWTAANVPDLTGQTVVVTGGNSGIGLEAARVCAERGARVIIGCRNPAKAESAVQDLSGARADAKVESIALDLSSLESVRQCAAELAERAPVIDVLVNNAGIMMPPYETTAEGFESQFGVNHLGHFALTGLVLPQVLNALAGRIVNISSMAHNWGKLDFDNLTCEGGKGYSPRVAYGRSKLANLLFSRSLQKRLHAAGSSTIALSAHPGVSQSNLIHRLAENPIFAAVMPIANRLFLQGADQGALPTLRAAFDPVAKGDDYYGPRDFNGIRGLPKRVGRNKAAQDDASAEKLWQASEQLTGVTFTFA